MHRTRPTDPELVAERLACRRGERLVFAGLDCRLETGGALLLTGSNGSGKSSLLRLLATLLTPFSGRLLWDGLPVAQDAAHYRALIHYVGHLDASKPALTPREMLGFWAALRESAAPAMTIAAALETFGLAGVADWPCRWLSAGQRRRLALARLVATPAPIWLLDEPTAALDSDGEARLTTVIAEHRAAGGRVAIATHQPLAVPDAAVIVLDEFAAPPEQALAALW
ncbi:MAG TPA: heme ABC exporter ATP-binding protein CcmA [Stellaceae bacterium]|nr:heme ABC exporter ATP-binding protein CcmA [Stellaceae bacterium]